MKKLKICIIAVTLNLTSYSQPVIGMGAGYDIKAKTSVMNIQAGGKFGNSHIYYNQIVHITRANNIAQIMGIRYGYNFGDWQPVIGCEWHRGSADKNNDPNTGWRLAYGITKYFKQFPVMINLGKTGKYITASIGCYKIIN